MSSELEQRGPKGELLYRIPFYERESTCMRPGCGMHVYWVVTKNNRPMIVDTGVVPGTYAPDFDTQRDGIGAAHWGQCKDKDYVRGKRKKQ